MKAISIPVKGCWGATMSGLVKVDSDWTLCVIAEFIVWRKGVKLGLD